MTKTKTSKDKSLPSRPVVGDLVKLKNDRVADYMEASRLAGYEWDPAQVRTVTRIDNYASGGGQRLFFDGAPFCFFPRDVNLAWESDELRRAMLLRRGWIHDKTRGTWKAPR